MNQALRDKAKLTARIGRIRGQVEAIERALENEAGCAQVMHLVAGVRGAMSGLMGALIEDHVRTHLAGPALPPENIEAAEQLIDVVRTYLK